MNRAIIYNYPANACEVMLSGALSTFLSTLCTDMDKTVWIAVNNAITKTYTFFYVYGKVKAAYLCTSYPQSGQLYYRLKTQVLKKRVDRLSTYTQCLL